MEWVNREQGWSVSNTTLMSERTGIAGGAGGAERGSAMAAAIEAWRQLPDTSSNIALAARAQLLELWVAAEVNRLTSIRGWGLARRWCLGPEGSIGKLAGAVLARQIASFTVGMLGAAGTLNGSYEMRQPTYGLFGPEDEVAPDPYPVQRRFVASPSSSLAAVPMTSSATSSANECSGSRTTSR